MSRNAVCVLATGLTGGLAAGQGHAANVSVGGFIDVHAGYGSNPFFNLDGAQSTPTLGATLSTIISRSTATSRSSLTGLADLNYYPRVHDAPQNYAVTLEHNQRISQKLSLQGSLSYENQVNPPPSYSTKPGDLLPQNDLLTIGQTERRLSGGLNFTWEPNARNLVQGGVNAGHASFGGGLASAYNNYGANLGVLHTFGPRTKIGLQGSYNLLTSKLAPNSRSGSFGLQVMQDLSSVWHLNAGGSMILQQTAGHFSKTFGFNGSLCGNYPRYTICLIGSRSSAPSGLGGLRTETQGGARVDYKLTPRSTVQLSGTYDISKDSAGLFPTQKYFDGALSYRRVITPRLSAGFSGRYQGRDYGNLYAATSNKTTSRSFSGTLNLVWNFGRTAT